MKKYNKYEPGMRYGKLTLVERTENPRIWKCVCDCGQFVYTQISYGARSCRKCANEISSKNKTKHGDSNNSVGVCARLYRIWSAMRTRCLNSNIPNFKDYGGRGIKFCKEWESYNVFREWALHNGYTASLQIDRIDNDGNYEPANCKWSTRKEQMSHTRGNRVITIDGQTMIFVEWLRKIGLWKPNVYSCAKRRGITVEQYLEYRYYKMNDLPGFANPA